MDHTLAGRVRKGRGALGNASGRFEPYQRVRIDDGWGLDTAAAPKITTEVTLEAPRSIISHNSSPDVPFESSINPYRGCEHGCIYCYARPSHTYLGLSAGLDFESRLFAKPSAAQLLTKELSKRGYRVHPIMLGSNTDPYQPIERQYKISREILRVCTDFGHPVAVMTKSHLVLRDLDLLEDLARRKLVRVALSLSTLDRALGRTMEPRAPSVHKRLEAIERLSERAVPVIVLAAPMIPFINDHELERILEAAKGAGAIGARYTLLRLPLELKDIFHQWLQAHFPGKTRHVLNALRQSRNGALNNTSFATRMRGSGHYGDLLAQRFSLACRRLKLTGAMEAKLALRTDAFRVPPKAGDQLSLF